MFKTKPIAWIGGVKKNSVDSKCHHPTGCDKAYEAVSNMGWK